MAILLDDGRVRMSDGRIVAFAGELSALDICEIVRDCAPTRLTTRPFTGAPAFISGGGGGGGGQVGPAGPAGPPGPPGPGGEQVVPATFVAAETREDQPLTRLGVQAAIDALPANGGDVYLGAGDLDLDGTPIVLPNKPVRIWGSARGATRIVYGGNTQAAFQLPSAQPYEFHTMTFIGDGIAGQTCFQRTGGGSLVRTLFSRINVGTSIFGLNPVEIFYDGGSQGSDYTIEDCEILLSNINTAYFIKAAGFAFRAHIARCTVRGNPSCNLGAGTTEFVDTLLIPTFPQAVGEFTLADTGNLIILGSQINPNTATITIPASSSLRLEASGIVGLVLNNNCELTGNALGTVVVNARNNRIVGNVFGAGGVRSIDLGADADYNVIADNTFGSDAGTDTEDIRIAGDYNIVHGNTKFANGTVNGIRILDTGAFNTYDANSWLMPTSTFGGTSSVNGVSRRSFTNTSENDYVELFTLENPHMIDGVGTIKNLDAVNELTIRETVIDLFGVTQSLETFIAPLASELLTTTRENVGTARPPYRSYMLEVKSRVADAPANYQGFYGVNGTLEKFS